MIDIITIIGCIVAYLIIFWLSLQLAEKNFAATLLFASILIFLLAALFAIPLLINNDNDLAYKLAILWAVFFAPVGLICFILFLSISVVNIMRNKTNRKNLN